MSVDSLPLEWDHTGDVGGSSSHEDEEEEEEHEEEGTYFSALSGSSVARCCRLSQQNTGCVLGYQNCTHPVKCPSLLFSSFHSLSKVQQLKRQ